MGKKTAADETEADSPKYTRNEILNKAKEIRFQHHHDKGIDQGDLKPWADLTGDKKARWIREAEEALGVKLPEDD